ncbi:MAG TPA: nitronate monooxygenase [Gemmatimonadaceae bacterium]|nr:nitronate monooxygenase [Gemmatimonadaceae bacterium]
MADLLGRIGVEHPIIKAPMAGGATTPALVSAVCNAGALGFIGGAYLAPEQIMEQARAVRERTQRPFGINLFVPVPPAPPPASVKPALDALAPYHAELGLPEPAIPTRPIQDFDAQLAATLESGASAFSFTFGVLPESAMKAVRSRGMLVLGTATTVDEAVTLERSGVDALVAQGSEAGAHRATFGAAPFEAALVGTMALVPAVVDAVRVPVIASGGIMDGRGIAAALALGAIAVQMGTAFLLADECGIPESYKNAIANARETDTRVTRAYSGRAARGIANRFMDEVEALGSTANLGYPVQNALTRPLRTEAAKWDRPEFLSLWAGQGLRLARREPAASIVRRLVAETEAVRARLQLTPVGRD